LLICATVITTEIAAEDGISFDAAVTEYIEYRQLA